MRVIGSIKGEGESGAPRGTPRRGQAERERERTGQKGILPVRPGFAERSRERKGERGRGGS